MKKLLVLILLMAMASAASAASVWFEVDESEPQLAGGGYSSSQIITINVVADFEIGSFALDIASNFGTAEGAGPVNPAFDLFAEVGEIVNSGGVLITGTRGGILTYLYPPLEAGEIIYSFEFHVPHLPDSTLIVIDDCGFVSFLYSGTDVTDVEALVIHTPEPMTIALLGLGGLFLRRRK